MNLKNSATSVTYDGITYAYPRADNAAVRDISFTVNPGELVVLVGPSGCGKSTLLRIAAGLLNPSQGRLLLDGSDTIGLPPEKRQIGWVPQSYALFEHLNVAENIAFGLRMRGIHKNEQKKQVDEKLNLCRITDFASRAVNDLSGGQRQRVAIARALAVNPRVLLLDEPLAALDPQLRVALRIDLENLLRESGVTTLFVTHDQAEALAIADRVVVLRNGEIQQYDTPKQLWNHPANSFVAEFVSSATVVEAKITAQNTAEIVPGLVAHLEPIDWKLSHVRLTLHPDELVLDPEGVEVTVSECEYNGGIYLLKGALASGIKLPFRANDRLSVGERVKINIRSEINIGVVEE